MKRLTIRATSSETTMRLAQKHVDLNDYNNDSECIRALADRFNEIRESNENNIDQRETMGGGH
jgi:hypothetical protein